MITIYPYEALGHADYGWLNAHYHFSFSSYRNPRRVGFGKLRVINDDIVQPHKGFDTHPHNDMEIITYVRKGAITHRDSKGNEGRTEAGDVQVMSAGTGILHSEYNQEQEPTSLYQIWIEPKETSIQPDWDSAVFPKMPVTDGLQLLVSGDGNAPLYIHQDAFIYAGRLTKDQQVEQAIRHQAYLLVSEGIIAINGKQLKQGDGAEITQTDAVRIHALSEAEILLIDVPA